MSTHRAVSTFEAFPSEAIFDTIRAANLSSIVLDEG
jgi:hypothetical protein